MPAEKGLVDGDILERNNPPVRIDLDDAVHEEKRVPVRKDPHDFGYAQFHGEVCWRNWRIRGRQLRQLRELTS